MMLLQRSTRPPTFKELWEELGLFRDSICRILIELQNTQEHSRSFLPTNEWLKKNRKEKEREKLEILYIESNVKRDVLQKLLR